MLGLSRSESERRTAIRQTIPKKASVEAETSTLNFNLKKVVVNEFHYVSNMAY